MTDLVPKLEQISVKPEKLILDPNNPRLISKDEDRRKPEEALDKHIDTSRMMNSEKFKIRELEASIKENGWWPIDYIFVKKFDDNGRYLVLEGNRRVTAIKNILNDEEAPAGIKKQVEEIKVMEITDNVSEDELKVKITYLLGVRHHGSLKKWSAFAQARNIYNRYLELTKQNEETFKWDESYGEEISAALSIVKSEVKERLMVYRAMEQIGNTKLVKESEKIGGGIKDRYYSVCQEVLTNRSKELKSYIYQNDQDFLLDNDSVERMIKLCHFDKPARKDAPINNPQQWRYLSQILKDQDQAKKKENIRRVEEDKERPDIVWAQRSEELSRPQWDKWLKKTSSVLKLIGLADDYESEEAKIVTKKLKALINELDKRDG